jgi:D-alanyl-D-alanine dipeptidase
MNFFIFARFKSLKNKFPLSQMRHESRVNFPFPTSLIVITCSHLAFSSYFKPVQTQIKPPLISNVATFKTSIYADSTKKLVRLETFVPQLVVDLKYSKKNNFTGQVLYENAAAYLRLTAAIALKKVNAELGESGLAIKVFDAYRPWSVTRKMWKLVHDERYAANPAKGSGHNRGAAVDVTIVHLLSNEELPMPTAFDDFSEKAHHSYKQLSSEVIANRALLRKTMEKHGFVALETEWWHYSIPQANKKYELLDLSFVELKTLNEN